MFFETNELTFCEYVNPSKLQELLTSDTLRNEWTEKNKKQHHKNYVVRNFDNERHQLECYLRDQTNGLLKIQYYKKKLQGRFQFGNCATTMRRKLRNYCLKDDYYDFDMVNSCFSILRMLGQKHKELFNYSEFKFIDEYCDNRQEWINGLMEELNKTKEEVKTLLITVNFGGEYKDYTGKGYSKKLQTISYNMNKNIGKILKQTGLYDEIQTEKNTAGSWIACLVQSIEANIVVGLLRHIVNNYPLLVRNPFNTFEEFLIAIYELDGFKLLKQNVDEFSGPDAVIGIINEWLIENMYNTAENQYIQFINKPMDEVMDLDADVISFNQLKDKTPIQSPSPVGVENTFSPIIITPRETPTQIPTPNLSEILKGIDDGELTSGLLATKFLGLYPDDWVSSQGILYGWNGIYWESGNDIKVKITKQIDGKFVDDLLKYSQTLPTTNKGDLQHIANFIFKVGKIRQLSFRTNLINDITTFASKNITFNDDPFKFAFNNKIFDLRTGLEITPNKTDYISITTGYDWIEPTQQQIDTMNEIIRKIQPYEDTRKFYLSILSTGLIGIQLQNIFILTGKGGNGKSIIDDLMLSATGNYGYKIPSKMLQEEFKTGANPEVNNLNYKRFVLGQEPSQNKTICCNVMKELTGSTSLNARNIYSSKCIVLLLLSLFLECNKLPNLDEVNEAVERRVVVIPFPSKFISEDKYDELISTGDTDETLRNRHIYKKNIYYASPEFRNIHKCALIKILMPHIKTFIENNNIPTLPNAVKIASANYLKQSDPIYEWFIENYERKEKSIIYEADIHNAFKSSEYYSKLPKKTQRELKRETFINNLKSNIFLSNILQPKLRDEYVELEGQSAKVKIRKDGFYGWSEKLKEEVEE
jgi:phage/plasmid-associated DNA primase